MRPRTPTAILRNRGSRHATNRTEPKSTGALAAMNDNLTADELDAYNAFKAEAEALGVLQSTDRAALRILAVEYASYERLRQVLETEGETYQTAQGLIRRRPEVAMMRDSFKAVTRLLNEFGLTPASRTRAAQVAPAEEYDDKSRFFHD